MFSQFVDFIIRMIYSNMVHSLHYVIEGALTKNCAVVRILYNTCIQLSKQLGIELWHNRYS